MVSGCYSENCKVRILSSHVQSFFVCVQLLLSYFYVANRTENTD